MSSSIPIKQIDGDVAVGRDVSIGGKGVIRGSVKVGHNLQVEGWLDAKNIKGPSKGLFKTVEKLRAAYPTPHDGWWALVGDTLPASIYVGDGGEWVATGKQGGNPSVDDTGYSETVEQLCDDVTSLRVDVSQNQEDIKTLRASQTAQETQVGNLQSATKQAQATADEALAKATNAQASSNQAQTAADKAQSTADKALSNAANAQNTSSQAQADANTAQKTAEAAQKTADTAQKAADKAQSSIENLKDSKGEADGIAPLDESGLIPNEILPHNLDNVLEFKGMVADVTIQQASAARNSTDENCAVVYEEDLNVFLLSYSPPATVLPTYYSNWLDADLYGEASADGRVPHRRKLFIDTTEHNGYYYNDTRLTNIGSNLSLGYDETHAFPGSEGVALRETVKSIDRSVSDLSASMPKIVTLTEAEYNFLIKKNDDTYYMIIEEEG